MTKRSVVLLLLAPCALLLAQTPDTATLNGHVVDQSQAAVRHVQVTVINTLSGLTRTMQTNQAGEFSFLGLPIGGTYKVNASKSGFATVQSD